MRYTRDMAFRGKLLLISALAALSSCCLDLSIFAVPSLPPQQAVAHLTVAHRGSLHTGLPDNSVAALRESISAGVPFLEVDVRRSAEGDLFIFHDGRISPDNSEAPESLRGARVDSLSRQERALVQLGSEQHIPLLAEALDTVKGSGSVLQLDFKGESDSLVFAALDLLRARGQLHEALLQIRDPSRIPAVLAYQPNARVLARVRNDAELNQALQHKVEFVELERWATFDAIEKAHQKSVKALANVAGACVDEPDTWRYLRTRGFDTIMTNHAVAAMQQAAQ